MAQAIVPLTLASQAGGAIFKGAQGKADAEAQARQSRINAEIARTRGIQADTTARQGLNDELASMRAVLGANSQRPNVGTMEVMRELRETRNRERRITVGGHRQQAADYRTAAANQKAIGRRRLLGGIVKAGPSLFDLYDYSRNGG